MRLALLVAGKDLKQRIRDRSAVVIGILAPFMLAAIVSFAFGDEGSFNFRIGIANEDEGQIGAGLVAFLSQLPEDTFEIKIYQDNAGLIKAMEDEEVTGAILVPSGFSTKVMAQQATEVVVSTSPDAPITAQVTNGIVRRFIAEVDGTSLAITTAVEAGALRFGADIQNVIDQAAEGTIPTSIGNVGVEGNEISSVSYFAPAMAIFFVFFTVQQAPLSLIIERREHTLQRMLAAPIKPGPLILGKFIFAFLIGMVSLVVLAVTTSQLLDAQWGDPVAGLALAAAAIFSIIGVMALASLAAKSEESAGGIGAIVAVVLAMLGGSFFPLTDAPQWIRSMSLATPNGWVMRGVLDLTSTGGGIEVVTTNIGVLVAIGLVTGGIALGMARRMVTR
jgi:ABC-2 type transport system permease protein